MLHAHVPDLGEGPEGRPDLGKWASPTQGGGWDRSVLVRAPPGRQFSWATELESHPGSAVLVLTLTALVATPVTAGKKK